QKEKDLEIAKTEEGIYYIKGLDIPVQLILLHQLSREKNLWLRSIGGRLSGWQEAEELIQEYKKHKKDERYRSVMDLIVRVNRDLFLEVKHMCQALEELMADELEAMRSEGIHTFAKLSRILLQQNRQKDLLRALEDEQYLEQLFQEYHI
ncbi:MAG TPA: 3-isopropylmalate dehydrogenase, partial [Candidatus Anaerostipes excrementavium]|nr:3-isopropylmalate dehydrogenase [Candidatus Anaerostipes excrementavium]